MSPKSIVPALFYLAMAPAAPAQKTVAPATAPALAYADVADLALASTIAAEVRIRKATQLKGPLAPGLVAGKRRYLVEADIMALIRGSGGLPPRITYIVDVSPLPNGKWPKLPRTTAMVFAVPVAGKPGEIRLVAPDAQQPVTPALSQQVRAILAEANAPAAPAAIVRVGQAFHVPGAIPGEGETQIFLISADGRPVSLSIWRAPQTPPRWAVSLGEIVDEGAAPPARDTLAWYRLACFLPQQLPPESAEALSSEHAQIAAEDYRTAVTGLGACQRIRGTQSPSRSS